MASPDSPVPVWIYRWLMVSTGICVIDGSFCVLRPYSMPGGCLEMIFYPYRWYLQMDKNYANPKDVFIWTQGFGNLIECAINLLVLSKFFKNIRSEKIAIIIVSTMTCYKTILFSLYSLEIPIGHVVESWFGEFMVYGMGSFWAIIPALAMWELGMHFVGGAANRKRSPFADNKSSPNHIDASSTDEEEDVANGVDTVDASSRNRYNLRRR